MTLCVKCICFNPDLILWFVGAVLVVNSIGMPWMWDASNVQKYWVGEHPQKYHVPQCRILNSHDSCSSAFEIMVQDLCGAVFCPLRMEFSPATSPPLWRKILESRSKPSHGLWFWAEITVLWFLFFRLYSDIQWQCLMNEKNNSRQAKVIKTFAKWVLLFVLWLELSTHPGFVLSMVLPSLVALSWLSHVTSSLPVTHFF